MEETTESPYLIIAMFREQSPEHFCCLADDEAEAMTMVKNYYNRRPSSGTVDCADSAEDMELPNSYKIQRVLEMQTLPGKRMFVLQ